MREKRLKESLSTWLWLPVLLLSVLVGAYLGKRQLTNPFLHYDVAFTEAARDEPRVAFFEEGALTNMRLAPGRALWQIAMGKLLGLDSQITLQFLPIGSALLAVTYYAFFKRLLGTNLVAALMTLHQMMNPSQLSGVYSIFAYAAGTALYLGFVLMLLRTLEKKRFSDVLLLCAIAVALNATHYAYTSWVVLTALIMNAALWIMRRGHDGRQRSQIPGHTLAFVGFVVVIFFAFNEAFYVSYLPHVGDAEVLGGGWASFFKRLPWLGFGAGEVSYEFSYGRDQLLNFLSTLHLLVILAPIVIGIPLRLFERLRVRRHDSPEAKPFTITEAMIWALVLTGVADILIYSLRGNVGLKYLILIYPVATIWFLRQIGGRRLVAIGLTVLLGLSVARLAAEATVGSIQVQPLSYAQTETVATWYHQRTAEPNALILSDLNLYGKVLVKGATYRHPGLHRPRLAVVNPEIYDWLLGREVVPPEELARIDYILMDVSSDASLRTPYWRELQPLGWHRDMIEQNSAAVKLYDDGFVWILQP